MKDYSDIINIEYEGPKNHPRMPRESRAAQFASFKALSGYEDELKETRRIREEKVILTEDQKELLDNKLKEIIKKNNIQVKVTYFVKDLKKTGGYYKTIINQIKKIDLIKKEIIFINNEKILINNIIELDIVDDY